MICLKGNILGQRKIFMGVIDNLLFVEFYFLYREQYMNIKSEISKSTIDLTVSSESKHFAKYRKK